MGASGGMSGTMRAQYHLRQVAVFLDMHVMNTPEVFVRKASTLIDAEGKLNDDATKKAIGDHLVAFAAWTKRFKNG
jgi:chromate reductase